MDYPVFVVPGIGNSGPLHWQSVWEASHPGWRRLVVEHWDQVACDDWVSAIEQQVAQSDDTLIVAHSLGCLAVAHWASRYSPGIRGALLVAVPNPAASAFPAAAATGFAPLPLGQLPFPTVVVSSFNDPYGSTEHARRCAKAWGSELVEVGGLGHLNADSNLGDWPEGFRLLRSLG
jgi:predicted alpha/beta hydrolase family esterase